MTHLEPAFEIQRELAVQFSTGCSWASVKGGRPDWSVDDLKFSFGGQLNNFIGAAIKPPIKVRATIGTHGKVENDRGRVPGKQ